MDEAPIYIASDAHLGAAPPETEPALLSWLHHCGAEASQVILNGDLFDFWFEYGSVVPRGHTRVLGALASLVDAGIPVLYLGGNHDWWGGTFLREEIGVDFRQEPVVMDLQGRRTLLAHGDGLGTGDVGYRVLRYILRGQLTRFAFRWLHPDWGAWVARRVSRTETRVPESAAREEARARFLEDWARERLAKEPGLDLVVLGHTHQPVLTEMGEGRYYLNSGDWISHRTYGVLASGEPPELRVWEG